VAVTGAAMRLGDDVFGCHHGHSDLSDFGHGAHGGDVGLASRAAGDKSQKKLKTTVIMPMWGRWKGDVLQGAKAIERARDYYEHFIGTSMSE